MSPASARVRGRARARGRSATIPAVLGVDGRAPSWRRPRACGASEPAIASTPTATTSEWRLLRRDVAVSFVKRPVPEASIRWRPGGSVHRPTALPGVDDALCLEAGEASSSLRERDTSACSPCVRQTARPRVLATASRRDGRTLPPLGADAAVTASAATSSPPRPPRPGGVRLRPGLTAQRVSRAHALRKGAAPLPDGVEPEPKTQGIRIKAYDAIPRARIRAPPPRHRGVGHRHIPSPPLDLHELASLTSAWLSAFVGRWC